MNLLDLPREVRQHILDWVISSKIIPPTCPSSSQEGRQPLSDDCFAGRGIWHLPPQSTALPLLLVSKQIHDETKDVLQRVTTDYHVDIMYVKQYGLWTTWSIAALPPTRYINSVHATVRIFEPEDDLDSMFEDSLDFSGGDGGPELAVWAFYSLLVVLLRKGPGYLPRQTTSPPDANPHYIIKEVTIDVLAPADGYHHKSFVFTNSQLPGPSRVRPGEQNAVMSMEQRLAHYMMNNLTSLIRFGYYTANYGMVIVENITDSIIMLINGKDYQRWDLDEWMQADDGTWWGETPTCIEDRQRRYRLWRTWLDKRRELMRQCLPLPDDRPFRYIM